MPIIWLSGLNRARQMLCLVKSAVVTTYSDYRDFGGVKFPTRIQQTQAGSPVLDVTVKEVQPNAPPIFRCLRR